ncbi:hypothetical protein [Psychrobacter sp. SZ93C1]|uniref:hypothetical protein n=1 Tax=Psychrobacter sp. SZ93C1 TaxID=2792058 RepID=UPI0018CFC9EA|nr:hypothetical protein [Psychrobacter sp. SZ93C1]MBH0064521.1 hypothetical protein [Psychrobacter sp. SZ93C1]
MLGYCSNSPLRCDNAYSIKILNRMDSCCPECCLFLLPAQDVSQQLNADEQFLRFAIMVIICTLFTAVYIYYFYSTLP